MLCPECKTGTLKVVETFVEEMSKHRHYRCKDCRADIITSEQVSIDLDLKDLRRIKSMKRRKEKAMRTARQHIGNPFAGLFR